MGRHAPVGAKPLVLYVEDHPANTLIMQALFDRLPQVELLTACCGAEALALAHERMLALLLLDIGLPDCRGDELLERLRVLPGCGSAPAMAVTAECGFEIGGTGFVELWEKPLDLPRVLARLQQLLAPATASGHTRRREPARDGAPRPPPE